MEVVHDKLFDMLKDLNSEKFQRNCLTYGDNIYCYLILVSTILD